MKQTVFKLPLIIGVAGGTSCGKTLIVNSIMENLDQTIHSVYKDRPIRIYHLEMHSFYKELDEESKELARNGQFNYDHPDAIDFELCAKTLRQMREGETVEIAEYDMKTCTVTGKHTVYPSDVIIIEGILLLYDEKVRNELGVKLFVEESAETRLRKRLEKYIHEYQRSPIGEINLYTEFVKPAFEEFCRPTKKFADVIIPRGSANKVAIDMISSNLQEMFRRLLASSGMTGSNGGRNSQEEEGNSVISSLDENEKSGSYKRPH